MADYIVKDTELTSVANAIRTAGGTNSLLNFPNGFVNAVNNISGGSSDFSTATVTVINQTETPVEFQSVLLIDEDEKFLTVSASIFGGQTIDTEVVLYNGECTDGTNFDSFGVPVTIEATGDIEIIEGYPLITGDGTITISEILTGNGPVY